MAVRREPVDCPVVEFRDASYTVGGNRILDKLNLQLNSGEILVLLGRSGSGKTTALKMVNALLTPSSGQVLVQGRETTAWDVIRLRRSIGYVIQEAGLFPHFTVKQNVELVPKLEGKPSDTNKLLQDVDLDPEQFASRYPRQLSGGQRQRVGVARALAADPALLLFDEPFGAVDPVTRLELQNQFLKLRREFGKTSLFVTHDIREALRLGTRIGLLHKGKLDVLATPAEFVKSTHPEAKAFLACLDEPVM